jgi:hypothetical protein
MAQTLEALIEKEFTEVQKAKEDLLAKRAEIDQQIAALDLRIRAAENYRATLEGKFVAQQSLPLGPKARMSRQQAGSRAPRAPRGSREHIKNQIVELLTQHPEGLIAGQIIDQLTDYAKQLPNVLSLMKKDGVIHQEAKRGPYFIPPEAA